MFFRDPDTWTAIRDKVVPDLGDGDDPIRVWSAGCASGQEAYTAVMLLAEAIGVDAVKERFKVYATDVDEEALEQARRAVYTDRELESLPDAMRERYFDARANGGVFSNDLRRVVTFGRHVQSSLVQRLQFSLAKPRL